MYQFTQVRGSTRAKLKVSEANEFDVDVLLKLPVDLNKRPCPIEVPLMIHFTPDLRNISPAKRLNVARD
jgi:hypothetical protein